MVQTSSNIWVAASDGDLDRVRHLIEVEGFSPNEMDTNRYSPMHAAASYAHLELLDYLISKGGDINLVDGDGDTPLFGVETVSFAEAMIDRGADPLHMNNEGLRADEALEDSDPEIASFLRALPIIQVLTQPFIPIDQIPSNVLPSFPNPGVGQGGEMQFLFHQFPPEEYQNGASSGSEFSNATTPHIDSSPPSNLNPRATVGNSGQVLGGANIGQGLGEGNDRQGLGGDNNRQGLGEENNRQGLGEENNTQVSGEENNRQVLTDENIAPMLDERILNGQILFGSNQFVSAERTTAFLERTQRILQESEEQGVEPDQRLLEEVEMAMREAVDYGRDMAGREGMNGHATEEERKRIRTGAS
ncbi:hypothetical protein M231_06294 [Tremella mesenterica]|uniref:Uncharacterized protein n=1 Tax=Tremella mesenterica TaxID=5217 RepID=A0A4V1M3D1_TREME|nr:hypothetical protein M231_06294 [Tremella mesenterica]